MELITSNLSVALPAIAAAIAIGVWGASSFFPFVVRMFSTLLGVKEIKRMLELHVHDEDQKTEELQDSLDKMHSKQEELSVGLQEIIKEFKPNSGETVRDALNRIESNVDLTGERQRARMLDSKEMLIETDKLGNVVWVNRTIVRKLGRLPGELYGSGWLNVVHAKHRDHFKTEWMASVAEGREFETQVELVTTTGELIETIVKAYLMHDINQNPLGWLISFQKPNSSARLADE